ncbi:hypothetical protein MG293_001394 [Ovis ammon polii]|uniref:Uncharacterized protein n=1 Tax=Ovis ammon polii TaxID=230172 RepID=A0AAD4URD4_OVIAM|nr:hypothetical protein MG293_001394 [Ovis ammon polii]
MLTSYVDGTRVRWSSPRPGGRTADARGTTDTRLPAAEMVGTGLRSRRVERAEGTDPSPAPEGVKKRNDACPTPGSEVQPHPRTGQVCVGHAKPLFDEDSNLHSCKSRPLAPSSDRKRSQISASEETPGPRPRAARPGCSGARRGDVPLGVRSQGLGSLRSAATLLPRDDFSRRERMEAFVSSTAREKSTDEAGDGPE